MSIETGKRYALKGGDRDLASIDVLNNSYRVKYAGVTASLTADELAQLLGVLGISNFVLDLAISMKKEVARGSKEVEEELESLVYTAFNGEMKYAKRVEDDFPGLNQGIN